MTETSIIPLQQTFYDVNKSKIVPWELKSSYTLDLESIACFCALGFMLEKDTFFNEIKVIPPSTKYFVDNENRISNFEKKWSWHYSPKSSSFSTILDDFTDIFETYINNNTNGKSILLPISGGLDSRTIIVPIKNRQDLILSSYEFENGYRETVYGKEIANIYKIPYYSQIIPRGYLWNNLEKISKLNNCFTEFTHSRQCAVLNNWSSLGQKILLGHGGDLFFDSQYKLKTS